MLVGVVAEVAEVEGVDGVAAARRRRNAKAINPMTTINTTVPSATANPITNASELASSSLRLTLNAAVVCSDVVAATVDAGGGYGCI